MNDNVNLLTFIDSLLKYDQDTKQNFEPLFAGGYYYPIPFFGDVLNAKVITIGANPSHSEFSNERNWPNRIDSHYLLDRLQKYFTYDNVKPHKWFNPFINSIFNLGVSYENGSAAHMDFSFRATQPLSKFSTNKDLELIEKMISEDLEWFLKILKSLDNSKLLLLTGTITKKFYSIEFLKKYCCKYGFSLIGDTRKHGEGWIGEFQLIGHKKEIPIFFISTSPSARDGGKLMVKRIIENRKLLERHLH